MAFFTVEETEGITDLKSVLESYMFPEIASSLPAPAPWTSWTTWATGARSLDEWDNFINEVNTQYHGAELMEEAKATLASIEK